MYSTSYQACWPSGLRQQTQENFSIEISDTRMCAWVRIQKFLSIVKNLMNKKPWKTISSFAFERQAVYSTRLRSSRSKILLHNVCTWVQHPLLSEQKNQNGAFQGMQFFAMTVKVLGDQLTILKTNFLKFETICKNKLCISTIQNSKNNSKQTKR